MSWIIESYKGAGRIRLGMSAEQVEREIGPPDNFRSSKTYTRKEFRALRLPVLTYKEAGVSEITFSRQAKDVSLLSIADVFSADPIDVLNEIEKKDNSLREIVGIVVSLKLGVSLSGFHDRDEDQKAITIFREGLLDNLLKDSTHFTLS